MKNQNGGGNTLLDATHNPWLVLASLAIALMAGFTGLTLTRGASSRPVPDRKRVVAMAAVALGGGIWSMHFVAMLGLQLPILFYYDALITLISALTAILMVGLALLILHFRPRSTQSLLSAGAILGLGIVVMHFIGMAGMELCRPMNSFADYGLSSLAAIVLSCLAIWVAYDTRSNRNILIGTLCFGGAVVSVHYLAIASTDFWPTDGATSPGPLLSNHALAMGVTVAAFLICAAFLLSGVTFLAPAQAAAPPRQEPPPPEVAPEAPAPPMVPPSDAPLAGVPYERDGRTHFAGHEAVAALRAEGHYSLIFVGGDKLFCPWSITEAETRLSPAGFVRVHRSYLVNPAHVTAFERTKDSGALFFEGAPAVTKVPVSRSRLAPVRDALGL